jgi:hypothetical protein
MVALAYSTRHPNHPGKLILVSTEATGHSHLDRRVELFERLGGPEVGALTRRASNTSWTQTFDRMISPQRVSDYQPANDVALAAKLESGPLPR